MPATDAVSAPAAPGPEIANATLAGASFAAYGNNPSAHLFRSQTGNSYIAYRRWAGCIVALGGPGGDPSEFGELRERFLDWAGRKSVAWYGAGESDDPQQDVYLGQEAIVYPSSFTLEGKRMQKLRHAVRAAERAGVQLEYGGWDFLPEWVRAQIVAIDLDWERRSHIHLGFSVSRFHEATQDGRPWVAAVVDGRVEGFVTWLPGAAYGGGVLDLMKRRQGAVSGVMDYLLADNIAGAGAVGFEWLSLGVAPSAEMAARKGLAGKVGNMFSPGTLRAYKDKFNPQWQDRYLVLPRGVVKRQLALLAVAAVHVTGAPHNASHMLAYSIAQGL